MKIPKLVAHRGYADQFPENSMSAFQAAVDCGCLFLELDVQVSKDKRAVVIHDETLSRTGNCDLNVLENDWKTLAGRTIGESGRFGDKFKNEALPLLTDFAKLLAANPNVHAFVEIKEECVDKFGESLVLESVCEAISSVKSQCSIISFDAGVLFKAKEVTDLPIGYVLHKYDVNHLDTVNALLPDIVICNYKKIPDEDGSLWQGDWAWFLYEIVEPALAIKWAERGVEYIETMEIKSMLESIG